MKLLSNKIFLEHDTGHHPENRYRIESLDPLRETSISPDEKLLTLIHTQEYIAHVKKSCEESRPLDSDTLTSHGSFQAAIAAVSLTVAAAESGHFAIVRPPGHHAFRHRGSGFCLFNNIAIATQHLVNHGKRVLILDFDGHLGDGTMDIFYSSKDVLYWSIHQYPAFPGKGFVDEIGEGPGAGYTWNIPLPPGSADDIYLDVLNKFLPVAELFKPDILAVSAGFDAHQFDPLLQLRLSVTSYHETGKLVTDRFSQNFAVLEGGYNTSFLPLCIRSYQAGINGNPLPFKESPTVSSEQVWKEYSSRIDQVLKNLAPYWKF